MAGLSNMMRHYLSVKEKYPDCIIFYRLGDFYEMFFEDAVEASKILDLTLTGRDCGLEERAPMCGVPFHAADTYIAKLVENGYKVAICEQLSDPKKGELVVRDVVRVVTPGTVMDETMLEKDKNNYIASINIKSLENELSIGVAYCDLSTGEFVAEEIENETLRALDELDGTINRIAPSEIFCNTEQIEFLKHLNALKTRNIGRIGQYSTETYPKESVEAILHSQFGVVSVKPKSPVGVACASLVSYLKETQKRGLDHVNEIVFSS